MTKQNQKNQAGFTYLEVMIAIVILTIGILGQLAVLSLGTLRANGVENRNKARQMASSTIESIFAARDLGEKDGIESWDTINLDDVSSDGIFISDWTPIRENAGLDGILGTADDACPFGTECSVDGYRNDSPVYFGFERKIEIEDIDEAEISKKRKITVRIRYSVGKIVLEENLETMIADVPQKK